MNLKDRIEKYAQSKPPKIRQALLKIIEGLEDHEVEYFHESLGIAINMTRALKSRDLDPACPRKNGLVA